MSEIVKQPWAGWTPPAPLVGEVPLNGAALRARLSPSGNPKRPMCENTMSAMNHAMGRQYSQRGFLSQYLAFLAAFPEFRAASIYAPGRREQPSARRFKCGSTETFLRGSRQYRFRIVTLTAAGQPKTLEAVDNAKISDGRTTKNL